MSYGPRSCSSSSLDQSIMMFMGGTPLCFLNLLNNFLSLVEGALISRYALAFTIYNLVLWWIEKVVGPRGVLGFSFVLPDWGELEKEGIVGFVLLCFICLCTFKGSCSTFGLTWSVGFLEGENFFQEEAPGVFFPLVATCFCSWDGVPTEGIGCIL